MVWCVWCGVYRPHRLSVVPLTRSLVPIPDDIVETSDDEDDEVAAAESTAATNLSHQPRPFAVCNRYISAHMHRSYK